MSTKDQIGRQKTTSTKCRLTEKEIEVLMEIICSNAIQVETTIIRKEIREYFSE